MVIVHCLQLPSNGASPGIYQEINGNNEYATKDKYCLFSLIWESKTSQTHKNQICMYVMKAEVGVPRGGKGPSSREEEENR